MKVKNWMMAGLSALVLSSCQIENDNSADLTGSVTHIRDGDTIEVEGVSIRLAGVTCDERGTPGGVSATRAMTQLVDGQTLSCKLTGEKTYDREVGRCSLPDGRDIGGELILVRECGRCARYDPAGTYIAQQQQAGPYNGAMPRYCRT